VKAPGADNPAALSAARILQRLWRLIAGPDALITRLPTSVLRLVLGNFVRLRVDGHPFTVDLRDTLFAFRLLVYRTFEPEETQLLRSLIRPEDRVIDIGAHAGYYSVLFGRLCGPAGRVLAVEPHPENVALLERNLKDNGLLGRVDVVAAAVGEREGRVTLFEQRGGNRADNRVFNWRGASGRTYDVPMRTVDALAAAWDCVDLIKIDAQGFEVPIIRGMRRTLERNRDVILLAELDVVAQRAAGFKPEEMLDALLQHEFELREVLPGELRPVEKKELIERLDRQQQRNPGVDWLSNILWGRPGVLASRGIQ
jgi:FkbM family methyltransferase